MPLGENIENPEDDPVMNGQYIAVLKCGERPCIPIYRVSPQLLVTREHIMSDKPSTSVSDSFVESGDVAAVRGLDCESMRGVE